MSTNEENFFRIGKFLSHAGLCSRRDAVEFLENHTVLYNGEKIIRPDQKIPKSAELVVDGKSIFLEVTTKIVLLNKPVGYTCSHAEYKGEKSIFRLLPMSMQNFYFAGRLDKESRGLVILSNNGDFIHHLTHPSNRITKTYNLRTSRPLADFELEKCIKGVFDKNEILKFDSITSQERKCNYTVKLHQGRNREIRRVIGKFNVFVVDLQRISIGNYQVSEIDEGSYKISQDF